MITDVPVPTTVKVEPEILMTDVVADEYANDPARDPVTVGAVTVNGEFPKVFGTSLQVEKVGVALLIVTAPSTYAIE